MDKIEITALGISAIKISTGSQHIYVDSFINLQHHTMKEFDYRDADIFLITHDHFDHFGAEEVATASKETNALIIGPPSIAYPLLVEHNVPLSKIKVLYNEDPSCSAKWSYKNIRISSFASPHFHAGNHLGIHNSYLIEIENKRLYICGDTYEITENDDRLYNLDVFVINLVFFDKNKNHISIVDRIKRKYNPKKVILIHLMDCDWTIPINEVKEEVEHLKLDYIVVPDAEKPIVYI